MSTYDAALEAMSRDQLLALCSHQGEQITRLLKERGEIVAAVSLSFDRRHGLQRQKIEEQAREIGRLRKQLGATGKGAA